MHVKIQQQQPVNNPTGKKLQSKPITQVKIQTENFVVAQGSPTTTTPNKEEAL
jgi:hypothetical protein